MHPEIHNQEVNKFLSKQRHDRLTIRHFCLLVIVKFYCTKRKKRMDGTLYSHRDAHIHDTIFYLLIHKSKKIWKFYQRIFLLFEF